MIPCLSDWREAMDRPGAQQMKHLRTLFERWPFSKLIPDQSLVGGENPEGPKHIRAALARDNSFAIFYLPNNASVQAKTGKLRGKTEVIWFNPRTGASVGSKKTKNLAKSLLLTPPETGLEQDWILILKVKGADNRF